MIFGYGSLIFRPPPYKEISGRPGYIKGFVRRFNQLSHDHRGTDANPGRVVTLIDENEWEEYASDEPREKIGDENIVWGVMFSYPNCKADEIVAYLDDREKDGYTVRNVPVYDIVDGREVVIEENCRVYVGETHNPSFAPKATMYQVARQIATACGASGPNKEYLFKLAQTVPSISRNAHDAYLSQLYELVRTIDSSEDTGECSPEALSLVSSFAASSPKIPEEIARLWAHYHSLYHSQNERIAAL